MNPGEGVDERTLAEMFRAERIAAEEQARPPDAGILYYKALLAERERLAARATVPIVWAERAVCATAVLGAIWALAVLQPGGGLTGAPGGGLPAPVDAAVCLAGPLVLFVLRAVAAEE